MLCRDGTLGFGCLELSLDACMAHTLSVHATKHHLIREASPGHPSLIFLFSLSQFYSPPYTHSSDALPAGATQTSNGHDPGGQDRLPVNSPQVG